jgi:hypothetical protein
MPKGKGKGKRAAEEAAVPAGKAAKTGAPAAKHVSGADPELILHPRFPSSSWWCSTHASLLVVVDGR